MPLNNFHAYTLHLRIIFVIIIFATAELHNSLSSYWHTHTYSVLPSIRFLKGKDQCISCFFFILELEKTIESFDTFQYLNKTLMTIMA